jgi:pilus assembly protein CpaE
MSFVTALTADMEPTIRVLVLSDSRTAEGLAARLTQAGNIHALSAQMAFGEGLKAVGRHHPDVVVIIDTVDEPAAVVEALDAAAPGVPILAILPEGDAKGAQDCSLAGARATLVSPFDNQRLVEAIQQVNAKEQRRKQHAASRVEAGVARQQRPRVVAVHGAKGGVGATTVASNLAVALRQLTGRRVALIDGDVLSGDVGVLLDIASARNLSDLLPALAALDADFVDGLLVEHRTGVRVLLAPEQLQRAEALGGEDVQRVLASLRPYFDYQIVDTASQITPVTLAALDEADLIVLVVTPEVVALRSAARFLQLGAQLGYPPEKVLLVANRANAGKEVTPTVIEEYLQRAVRGAIPSDGAALVESVNAGELIVAARPHHRVAAGIAGLARDIATAFGWDPGVPTVLAAAGATGRLHGGAPPSNGRGLGLAQAGLNLLRAGRAVAFPQPK